MHDDEDDDTRALAVAPDPARGPLTTLDVIQRAVSAGVTADLLDKLIRMKERAEERAAAEAFAGAMALFQSRVKAIEKTKTAEKGKGGRQKYAGLDDFEEEVYPVATACGLIITFTTEDGPPDRLTLVCTVRHGTHTEATRVCVPVGPIQAASPGQCYAGAVTTAQRLALKLALRLAVVAEGQGAVETLTPEEAATIARLIGERAVDEAKLFAFAGAAGVASIPRSKFATIRDLLLKKPLKGGAQ